MEEGAGLVMGRRLLGNRRLTSTTMSCNQGG